MTTIPDIHPQLLQDCHRLGQLDSGTLLLSRNALLHWFILVPNTGLADLLDLPDTDQHRVLADCSALSRFLKEDLGYPKVNFAGLGNVVPQMHLHVIGRREGDACWPRPVWGALPEGGDWSQETLADIRGALQGACNLRTPDAG
ncbi:HIT family protein [Parahaliea mediterranea]|uniref:HIT family protein n=1 Tax=Parahaliea mediterranea TaxID=651086 RepID=A0A939IMC2_9GAMM|nr:HIT family protein [Parahaliea mediterranea]MBN7796862.1 HIT family protein [Parahaliea mediterranea]